MGGLREDAGRGMQRTIDFKRLAHDALGCSRRLVKGWLPGGKMQGPEYLAPNPMRASDKLGAFSINLNTGKWADFASNDAGGDLISLYAYINGLDNLAAAKAVAEEMGVDPYRDRLAAQAAQEEKPSPAVKETARGRWAQVLPVPVEAGDIPLAHPVRGRYVNAHRYYDAEGRVIGAVCRFKTSTGGKEDLPVCYARNEQAGKSDWRWLSFGEPRPLYGLDRLAKLRTAPVLIVEGEKCADAAHALLGDSYVCMTWPGGCKAVHKADWSPMAGRTVYFWPDQDAKRETLSRAEKALGMDAASKPLLPRDKQPGIKAMSDAAKILATADPEARLLMVQVPDPNPDRDGWDIADEIKDGASEADLLERLAEARDIGRSVANPGDEGDDDSPWDYFLLEKGGDIKPCLANISKILEHDSQWRGVIAYNEFADETVKLKPPPYARKLDDMAWTGQDDALTTVWITDKYGFAPSMGDVGQAVQMCAKSNGFNPVQDYINSLQWDGISRVDDWITDFIGAPKTDYISRVSRWFLMGMVARAMRPGIKFDWCLVLEGRQGLMKSTTFRVLGGEWYGDTELDLNSKDALISIRGKWLHEFSELGSFAKSEATRQKSFLSSQVDNFRPPYEKRDIKSPRRLVFCGTTNDVEWNKDPTGARRFWPVKCEQVINVDGLASVRDQLFSEAYQLFKRGDRYWPTDQEQQEIFNPEQQARTPIDSYEELLEAWVDARTGRFRLMDAATDCLKIDAARLTRSHETRIGNALKNIGCDVHRTCGAQNRKVTWYYPPHVRRGV